MSRRALRNFHEPGLGSRTGLRISTSVRPDDVQAYYEAGKRFMEPPEPTPPSRLGTPSSLLYDCDEGDEGDNGENEHNGRIQPPLTFEQAMELDAHRPPVGERSFVGVSLMDIQTSSYLSPRAALDAQRRYLQEKQQQQQLEMQTSRDARPLGEIALNGNGGQDRFGFESSTYMSTSSSSPARRKEKRSGRTSSRRLTGWGAADELPKSSGSRRTSSVGARQSISCSKTRDVTVAGRDSKIFIDEQLEQRGQWDEEVDMSIDVADEEQDAIYDSVAPHDDGDESPSRLDSLAAENYYPDFGGDDDDGQGQGIPELMRKGSNDPSEEPNDDAVSNILAAKPLASVAIEGNRAGKAGKSIQRKGKSGRSKAPKETGRQGKAKQRMADLQSIDEEGPDEEVARRRERSASVQRVVHKVPRGQSVETMTPGDGVRRSSRYRYAPLQYWRGETARFGRPSLPGPPRQKSASVSTTGEDEEHVDENTFEDAPGAAQPPVPVLKEIVTVPRAEGEGTFTGMWLPSSTSVRGHKRSATVRTGTGTRSAKTKRQPKGKEAGEDNDLDPMQPTQHPEDRWDDGMPRMGIIFNSDTHEEEEAEILCPSTHSRLRPTANASFAFSKTFAIDGLAAFGYLELDVGQTKPTKPSRDNNYCFFVFEGAVKAQVHRSNFLVAPNGSFFVPKGNTYSIENVSERKARLFFSQVRHPDGDEAAMVADATMGACTTTADVSR
ncbi:hypothetical protein FA10DRAFT_265644 [Acaromyces ingoldii]|uniref:Mif2/CENP-C cupin domain-containing protein n=1 Tax=Acaromyces ingoldii TaxID=215250 RepID=A0A316YS18_9BASI|nr:hypothetical protein FA10DRAFT_265644 [Acaromyces ingoldii]PWN91806.1 hypothetical protein FA10DRAFT_265644 [Acaromyces ingoldii]